MSDQINQENKTTEKKKSFLKTRASKIILSVLIVFIVFISIGGIVAAKHFSKFADGPHGFIIAKLTENLNLTESQKAQVEKIKDQIKEKMEAKKTDRESMFEEFANEFKKDNLDKTRLRELSQKKDQNAQEMKEFIMDKIIEFHRILTPEQRAKAIDNVKTMKGKFHDKIHKFKERED